MSAKSFKSRGVILQIADVHERAHTDMMSNNWSEITLTMSRKCAISTNQQSSGGKKK